MLKSHQLKLFAITAAASLALGLLALVEARPAEAAYPGKNGLIAFHSNRDAGAGEIYTMKPDGTAVKRITFPYGGNTDPVWSPDGTRIAFKSASRTNYEISVMNFDGSGRRQLTNTAEAESEPTWSPDGRKIAFVRGGEIWVMNADGTGQVNLTKNPAYDWQPAWSPKGDKIAFVSARPGDTNRNIYVMNVDGSGQANLTPNTTNPLYGGHDDHPVWAPDGSKIAYVHSREPGGGGVPNIWTMDPNGANKTNLSNSTVSGTEPAWSPDGTRIVYVGATDTNRNIWMMNANGSGQMLLHSNPAHDVKPDWQPNLGLTSVTLYANPALLTYGGPTTLYGRLTSYGEPVSGKRVILEHKPYGTASFVAINQRLTDANGSYAFTGLRPSRHTDYRVRFAGEPVSGLKPSASYPKRVYVKVAVYENVSATSVKLGKSLTVYGSVAPAHTGYVALTIKRNGTAISTRYVRLNNSRYSLVYTPPTPGTYSVVASYASHADHLGNTSVPRGFSVVK